MPGFGDFDTFAFDDGDATEDPFGVAASARETQWWTPYGASTRKKRGVTIGGFGGGGRRQTQTQGSYYDPNMAGPDPGYGTPSPSTTQRAILDAKQKQEDAARIFNGEAPRDPAAGGGDFDLGGGGVLKYQAPDPTNPGHQDAARERMDISLQDYNDYFADKEAIKKLEDDAYALPNRTGFWGSIDRKRDALLQRAEVLRRRNAERRAGNPSAFGMQGGGYDPNRYATVGNLRFDNVTGKYVVPDESTLQAMHRTASAGKTAAPHLETLIEPRYGKTVRVDQTAVPRNAQGQLVERYFKENPDLQGPKLPGVDMLGETVEEPYGVPDPAAVQAAQYRHENPAPEKPPKDATPVQVQAAHANVDARFDRLKGAAEKRLDSALSKDRPAIQKQIEQIERDREAAHRAVDERLEGDGGAKKPKSGGSKKTYIRGADGKLRLQ